jgi:hypothetical protein
MDEPYVIPQSDLTGRRVLIDQRENIGVYSSRATDFPETRDHGEFQTLPKIVDGLTPLGYFEENLVHREHPGAQTFSQDIIFFQTGRALDLVAPVRKKLVPEFQNSADPEYSISIIAYSNIKSQEEKT